MWPRMIVASGHAAAACAIASGVVSGSSPQWKSVGAECSAAAPDQPQGVLAGRVRDRRHRVELQALEAELSDRALEQGERLVAVPGVDARERVEPARVGGARLGDRARAPAG